MTKNEFLESGDLNFTVTKKPLHLYDTLYSDDYNQVPFYCTVNDKTGYPLGPVRSKYTVVQNETLLDSILNKLLPGSYDLSESKCGHFAGGRKIYFFIKLQDTRPFGSDNIDLYLYALSSHDGSQKLVFGITTKMHSCSNMFSILMSDKGNNHVLKHTKQAESISSTKINEMIERNMTGLTKLFKVMQDHTPDTDLIERVCDIIASIRLKKIPKKTAERRKELKECIELEMQSKGHTHYGLFNGVTYYLTHKYRSNWTEEYEMLVGNSNNYSRKAFNLIVKDLVDKGISLN